MVTAEGEEELAYAKNIKVGQLIKVRDEEEIPADIIIVQSSEHGISMDDMQDIKEDIEYQAFCYIQTSSLDGEKALKKRMAPKGVHKHIKTSRLLPFIEGYLVCDPPNSELYEFKGALNITSTDNIYQEEVCILSEN